MDVRTIYSISERMIDTEDLIYFAALDFFGYNAKSELEVMNRWRVANPIAIRSVYNISMRGRYALNI